MLQFKAFALFVNKQNMASDWLLQLPDMLSDWISKLFTNSIMSALQVTV
jgi:hypothetical protein